MMIINSVESCDIYYLIIIELLLYIMFIGFTPPFELSNSSMPELQDGVYINLSGLGGQTGL